MTTKQFLSPGYLAACEFDLHESCHRPLDVWTGKIKKGNLWLRSLSSLRDRMDNSTNGEYIDRYLVYLELTFPSICVDER